MGKLFLVTLSVIFSLAALEVGFRLAGVGGKLSPYANVRLRMLPQGYEECFGDRVSRPYYEQRGGCVQYRFNGAGFRRNGPTSLAAEPSTTRVLALGDSFLYGFGVHYEDTFLHRLEQSHNKASAADRLEMLNAGIPGADTRRELESYRRQWRPYRPHRVLLGLNLNDIIEFPTSRLIHSPKLFESPLRKGSRLVDWIATMLEERRDRDTKEKIVIDGDTAKRRAEFFKVLDELRRLVEEDGAQFTVMLFPVFYRLENYPFRGLHDSVLAALAERKIEAIDGYPWFRDTVDSRWWITPFDQHPNELAHAVIARNLEAQWGHPRYQASRISGPVGQSE